MKSQFLHGATGRLRSLARRTIDVVLPPTCPISGEPLSDGATLGPQGWQALQFITEPYCVRCGVPFSIDYGNDAECPSCLAEPPVFNRARAAIVYDDASHKLVVGYKHSDRTEHAGMFAAWMTRAGRELVTSETVVTAVPLHKNRLLSRRYNQSALLAAAIAKSTGASFRPDILERYRSTPPQKQLSASARKRNVAGAFRVREERKGFIQGAKFVIVDDVLTTGATLSACARSLLRAGAGNVDALVLARVVKGGIGAI